MTPLIESIKKDAMTVPQLFVDLLSLRREHRQEIFFVSGNFRIELAAAKAGGLSDPRNGTMLKMFNMIDIGERAGSGIPNIFRVSYDRGWVEPTITQSMNPDRITLSLVLSPTSTDKSAIKIGDKSNSAIKSAKRQMIIEYLTDHPAAKSAVL